EAGDLLEEIDMRHPRLVPWRAHGAAAATGLGDVELARQLADDELAISRRTGVAPAVMQSLRAVATARPEQALEALAEACELVPRTHDLLESSACLTAYGTALARAGREAEAREELRRALAVAHE